MDDSSAAHAMLRLPLRRPAGCGCVVTALALVALLLLLWAGYAWIGAGRSAWLPRVATSTSWTAHTATALPPTAPPSRVPVTETLLPATSTATPSPTPVATATPTSIPTATPPPTHTPPATPTQTATPRPTLQPTATLAVPTATSPAPTATAAGALACSAELRATIERAVEAQAQYMEGSLAAAALAAAWGGAAADAQAEADRLLAYGGAFSPPVEIEDVVWALLECRMEQQSGWMRVETAERWTYQAAIECAPGEHQLTARVEHFPAQVYALTQQDGVWRIHSWLTGPAEVEMRWHCPL